MVQRTRKPHDSGILHQAGPGRDRPGYQQRIDCHINVTRLAYGRLHLGMAAVRILSFSGAHLFGEGRSSSAYRAENGVTMAATRTQESTTMDYESIRVEVADRVALITIDRPKVLNALSSSVIAELSHALDSLEARDDVGAVVFTGSAKAFAAGADIAEMASLDFAQAYLSNFTNAWQRVAQVRLATIAAVSGYALGGGCELAMMCDFIIAADNAKFGQPEIKLGVIPGVGGTQRLTRAVGKAKAMELCLTGRMMDAEEAERAGLVSRIVPASDLLDEVMKTARLVANMSKPAVMLAKEAVNRAYETTLEEGCRYEKRLFQAAFALEDQSEGMSAFLDKREPQWKHR